MLRKESSLVLMSPELLSVPCDVMRFCFQHKPVCIFALTIGSLQHFCKPKDSGLCHKTLTSHWWKSG